jgi:TolB-like protein/Tfp pilus assembly protein PilF
MAEGGGDEKASGSAPTVFISYASPDAAIADAIVSSLERRGVACWIAPRDVTPGALYADVIIRAINEAKVLVLVLSQNAVSSSHVGKEVERASAKGRPIIAVRTDTTPLTPALEYFLSESQWIDADAQRMEAAAAKLLDAIRRLQGSSPKFGAAAAEPARDGTHAQRPLIVAAVVLAVLALAGLLYWLSRSHPPQAVAVGAPAVPANASQDSGRAKPAAPPPHSIAVLPFVNMSGDPKQDYFSDGLSEELLNSLAAIPDLQVAARTSSFSFKGKNADVADIAHELNVGAVLEGSVRKDGNEVRITAQLINALTGFHLWSHTYDRDLKNVLALQTEIATAVTQALQATLMAGAAPSVDIGGTQSPAALDAYLRGKNLERQYYDKPHAQERVAAFVEAIRLDPQFAKAYVGASDAQNGYANNFAAGGDEVRSWMKQARANAEKAVALAPELGEAHAALAAAVERGALDFARAQAEYERALQLSPSDVNVLLQSGIFFVGQGHTEAGIAGIRKAIALDQLNPAGYTRLAVAMQYAHRYGESIEASDRALGFNPNSAYKHLRGLAQLLSGDLDAARQSCTPTPPSWMSHLCLSILDDKLQQRHEAEAELAEMKSQLGDSASYQYAEIYAQWGDLPQALNWLETAYHLPDPGIGTMEVDEFVNPLRKEPRFQAIERALKFPSR